MTAQTLSTLASSTSAFEWTETNSLWLIENPIRIVIYIAAGLIGRWTLHRVIDRATRRPPPGADGRREQPALLKHLRDRTPKSLRDPKAIERRQQRAETIGSVLKSTVSILILVWVSLTCLSVLEVNIAPFVASAGLVGLAIGFGAQNLVKDFVSGVFMLLEDQYGVGDVVDLGEAIGEVESVGLRVTTIRDIDGTLWYVRNGEITRVGNMSQDYAVARIEIPVAHNVDLERAQEVALEAAQQVVADESVAGDVLGSPEMLGVQDVSADMVTLRILLKTRPNAQWSLQRRIRKEILAAYEANNIRLPYPSGREFGPSTMIGGGAQTMGE